jgi:hypothetical protein
MIDFTLITAQHACILTSLLFIMRELKILYDVKSKYLLGMTITLYSYFNSQSFAIQ